MAKTSQWEEDTLHIRAKEGLSYAGGGVAAMFKKERFSGDSRASACG